MSFSWLKDPYGIGVWTVFTIVVLLVIVLASARDACGDPPTDSALEEVQPFADVDDVEDEIYHFLRGVKRGKRWNRARQLAELTVKFSKDIDPVEEYPGKFVKPNDVDPLAVTVNFFYENSFYSTRKGAIGELGLGQIHPRNIRALYRSDGTKFDFKKFEDNVEAGARWLGYTMTKCSTLEQGYSAFKMGSCRPVVGAGKLRARKYRKARTRLGLSPIS